LHGLRGWGDCLLIRKWVRRVAGGDLVQNSKAECVGWGGWGPQRVREVVSGVSSLSPFLPTSPPKYPLAPEGTPSLLLWRGGGEETPPWPSPTLFPCSSSVLGLTHQLRSPIETLLGLIHLSPTNHLLLASATRLQP